MHTPTLLSLREHSAQSQVHSARVSDGQAQSCVPDHPATQLATAVSHGVQENKAGAQTQKWSQGCSFGSWRRDAGTVERA